MRRSTTTWPLAAVLAASLSGALSTACGPADEAPPPTQEDPNAELVARAASLELPTAYVPPPGDALEHHTAGFAKILCSAVFITGLDPADAAANVGGFTSPFEARAAVVDTAVDRVREEVRLTLPSGTVVAAKRYGSQGCVTRAVGEDSVHFRPSRVVPRLPDAATTPWPMGDALPDEPLPPELDMARVALALEQAFGPPEAMTQAVVITYKGRIVAERYGQGADLHTPLESWSMGKGLSATLMGVLIQRGVYDLWQGAPVPEWRDEGDPRREVRIGDLMRMSSGLRIRAPQDPDYDPEMGYPDHMYLYTGRVNAFAYAATRPLQWPPNTVGRFRNTDAVLVNYLVRLAVEGTLREDYHAFPQRALFDRIGIRGAVLETDPYGNFLTQGYALLPARDWVRLANLYLQDGVWNGERILPEGYAGYARTVAPAWEADGRPVHGGAFQWLNTTGIYPIPRDASYFSGAGGQVTLMIPSHGIVVARLGKYRGARAGVRALRQGLETLMEAVPPLPPHP